MRHAWAADIQRKGAAKSAKDALAHLHTESREFVLHLDVDVIAQEDFAPVNVPGTGGLRFDEVKAALGEMLGQKTLVGLDVAQYNPERDPDGSGARKLVELLSDALSVRLQAIRSEQPAEEPAPPEAEPAADALPAGAREGSEPSAEENPAADSPPETPR